MESATPIPSLCNPAGYGEACAGCSKAKCKCFFQSDGSGCERCYRLGKVCEPPSGARKRKARRELPAPPRPSSSGIEGKLDDVLSLLRSQATEKTAAPAAPTVPSTPNDISTPSTQATLVEASLPVWAGVLNPDVEIDTNANVVNFIRPSESSSQSRVSTSPILEDIAVHKISDLSAENQLATFRRIFLLHFPFVHLPVTITSAELRRQKPLLWLVIMTLTTNVISQQFAMEETIWKIVSQRIVCQHHADLDSMLGLICFSSWSHYFKQDKPFMCMLTQLAVSLTVELGLHVDAPPNVMRVRNSGRILSQKPLKQNLRTIEERRALLALFSLTSSTWRSYRSTEPFRWTPYMDDCARILGEAQQTPLDSLLLMQVKCQLITNQLSNTVGGSEEPRSGGLFAIMLRQFEEVRKSVPDQIRSERPAQIYLYSTELMIRESCLGKSKAVEYTGASHLQRLQSLESTLAVAETLRGLIFAMPFADWVGVTVETFTQFTHCLLVLFNLITIEEPGWDREETKRRADIFKLLDRVHETVECVPVAVGMVDAEGPRSGLFFKVKYLIQAIKALFQAALAQDGDPDVIQSSISSGGRTEKGLGKGLEEAPIPDDFLADLAAEPWLSDILDFSFESGPEGSVYLMPSQDTFWK